MAVLPLHRECKDGQPPPWVQKCMSSAGWQHCRRLSKEEGYPDKAAPAITKPAPHTEKNQGFSVVCQEWCTRMVREYPSCTLRTSLQPLYNHAVALAPC